MPHQPDPKRGFLAPAVPLASKSKDVHAPMDWKSEDAHDRVRSFIYQKYGLQSPAYRVNPCFVERDVARYRVDFRNDDGTMFSSFRVVAEVVPDSMMLVMVERD